jgi:hypothetical protein
VHALDVGKMNTKQRALVGLAVVVLAYPASYFSIMRPGFAFDPVTFRIAYPSICLFARPIRVPGDLSIYGHSSHPLNLIYAPLDRIFRKKTIAEQNTLNKKLASSVGAIEK